MQNMFNSPVLHWQLTFSQDYEGSGAKDYCKKTISSFMSWNKRTKETSHRDNSRSLIKYWKAGNMAENIDGEQNAHLQLKIRNINTVANKYPQSLMTSAFHMPRVK